MSWLNQNMILRHRAWSLLVLLFVLQLLHLQLATADVDGGKTNSQAVEEPPPSELVDSKSLTSLTFCADYILQSVHHCIKPKLC